VPKESIMDSDQRIAALEDEIELYRSVLLALVASHPRPDLLGPTLEERLSHNVVAPALTNALAQSVNRYVDEAAIDAGWTCPPGSEGHRALEAFMLSGDTRVPRTRN
jgi:hypothetical protein